MTRTLDDALARIAALEREVARLTLERDEAREQFDRHVEWTEREVARLREALRGLLSVIETDQLIPESVSYMRQARQALRG